MHSQLTSSSSSLSFSSSSSLKSSFVWSVNNWLLISLLVLFSLFAFIDMFLRFQFHFRLRALSLLCLLLAINNFMRLLVVEMLLWGTLIFWCPETPETDPPPLLEGLSVAEWFSSKSMVTRPCRANSSQQQTVISVGIIEATSNPVPGKQAHFSLHYTQFTQWWS